MRGTARSTPGVAMGTQAAVWISPPLPREQPEAGGCGSTSVTSWPSRCRYKPMQIPTIPAPTIVNFAMGTDVLTKPKKVQHHA